MPSRCGDREAGTAVVEFVLVSILVLVLLLGVLQLGFALHVRNTLQAAASDGARHGGAAGREPSDAAARTREVIDRALADHFADGVSARRDRVEGIPTVVVEVRAALPVLGPWGPPGRLRVRAHAFAENR